MKPLIFLTIVQKALSTLLPSYLPTSERDSIGGSKTGRSNRYTAARPVHLNLSPFESVTYRRSGACFLLNLFPLFAISPVQMSNVLMAHFLQSIDFSSVYKVPIQSNPINSP
jgi:hypothetical protein